MIKKLQRPKPMTFIVRRANNKPVSAKLGDIFARLRVIA